MTSRPQEARSAATPSRRTLTERIIRVPKGQPIPEGYRFKQLLGEESNLVYGPSADYTADVVLVEEDESDA